MQATEQAIVVRILHCPHPRQIAQTLVEWPLPFGGGRHHPVRQNMAENREKRREPLAAIEGTTRRDRGPWSRRIRGGVLAVALGALAPLAGGGYHLASAEAETPAPAASPAAKIAPFGDQTVVDRARDLARSPYAPPPANLPESLSKLEYDQYRDIRFDPAATIWAEPGSNFRLQLLPLGYLFKSAVEVSLVKGGVATHLAYRPDMFTVGKLLKEPLPAEDVGFSGFRLLFPVNDPERFDEVGVFQGASYFRSLGRDQWYGLSSRGLALKVGDPAGEEFPVFRAFWLEEPAPGATAIVLHALLDSESLTGAYRFELRPGQDTVMKVDAVLFPRVEVSEVGLAPGTSMYMFSANGRAGVDDFRPEVHDSDGLLMFNGRGEHLWRPLANPTKLQINAFEDERPAGFGLMQRNRDPAAYQDFESHFEKRPSLWVEPVGGGGPAPSSSPRSPRTRRSTTTSWPSGAPGSRSPPARRSASPTSSTGAASRPPPRITFAWCPPPSGGPT